MDGNIWGAGTGGLSMELFRALLFVVIMPFALIFIIVVTPLGAIVAYCTVSAYVYFCI